MKRLCKACALLAVVFGTVALVSPTLATANETTVLNFGRDDMSCSLAGTWTGAGHATLVLNDAGKIILSCSGAIDQPPPESSITMTVPGSLGTTCGLVITAGGTFTAYCKN